MKRSNRNTLSLLALVALVLGLSMQAKAQGNGRNALNRNLSWMSELNLNSQQLEKINQMQAQLQPAVQDIRQKNRTFQAEIRRLDPANPTDMARISTLQAQIDANETAVQALQQNHHDQIRVLLTAEQQLIFDQYQHNGGTAPRGAQRNNANRNDNWKRG